MLVLFSGTHGTSKIFRLKLSAQLLFKTLDLFWVQFFLCSFQWDMRYLWYIHILVILGIKESQLCYQRDIERICCRKSIGSVLEYLSMFEFTDLRAVWKLLLYLFRIHCHSLFFNYNALHLRIQDGYISGISLSMRYLRSILNFTVMT